MGDGTAWGGRLPCKQKFRWDRYPYPPPARRRHYTCVAQRLAKGSLICASGQTLTYGFLIIGLVFSPQLHNKAIDSKYHKHLLWKVDLEKSP